MNQPTEDPSLGPYTRDSFNDPILQKAKNLVEQNRHEEVVDLLTPVIDEYSNDFIFNTIYGMSTLRSGKNELALEWHKKMILEDSNSAIGHNGLGIVCGRIGEYQKCVEHISKSEEIAKTVFGVEALYERANAYYELERYDMAMKDTYAFVQMNNTAPDIYELMAKIFIGINDINNALKAYEKTIQLDPNQINIIADLIRICNSYDELLIAEGIIVDIIPQISQDSDTIRNINSLLVLLYKKLNEKEKMRIYVDKIDMVAMRDDESPMHPIIYVAFVMNKYGFKQEVKELLDYEYKISGNNDILLFKFRNQEDDGDYHEALDTINKYLEDDALNFRALGFKINLLIKMHQPLAALEVLQPLLCQLNYQEQSIQKGELLVLQSIIYKNLYRLTESLESFEEAEKISAEFNIEHKVEVLLELNKLEEVRALLAQLEPERMPENVKYIYGAEMLYRAGIFDKMGEMMPTLYEYNPSDPYMLEQYSLLLSSEYDEKDIPRALEMIQKAIELSENNRFKVTYAKILVSSGSLKEAVQILDRVLLINPLNIQALMEKAAIHERYSEYEEANELYNKITELTPSYVKGWNKYAQSFVLSHRIEEGIEVFDYALEITTDDADRTMLYASKAMGLFELKKYDKAISCANSAIELGTKDHIVYYIKSMIHSRNNEHQLAYETIENIIDDDFNNNQFLLQYASSLFKVGKLNEAKSVIEKVIENEPSSMAEKIKDSIEDELSEERTHI